MNTKGTTTSPFILIMLVLLMAAIYAYNSETDSQKSNRITTEGLIIKNLLETEEKQLMIKSLSLFASYQAAYETGINSGNETMLRERIMEHINNKIEENYTVSIQPLSTGEFILKKIRGLVIERNTITFKMKTNMSIERYIDARFYLLYNQSKEFNHTLLEEKITENIIKGLEDKINYSLDEYGRVNNKISFSGEVSIDNQLGNSRFIVNLTEDALMEAERSLMKLDSNNSLVIIPEMITAQGLKNNYSGETLWNWHINLTTVMYILDQSKIEENEGGFNVLIRKPIMLLNSSLVPLKYRTDVQDIVFNITLKSSGVYNTEAIDDYTREEFLSENHKPTYHYKIRGVNGWTT